MEKINLPFFYQLGALLKPLTEMEVNDSNRVDIYIKASAVSSYVRGLLDSYSALTVCRSSGEELIKATGEMYEWLSKTPSEEWGKEDHAINLKYSQLINSAKVYETVCKSPRTIGQKKAI